MALSNTMGLTVRFKADTTSLMNGIKRTSIALNTSFRNGVRIAISVVKKLTYALVGASGLVTALAKSAASAVDVRNKFRVVFKGVERIGLSWARQMHKNFRLPMTDLKQYLATLQDTLFPLLKNREEAAKLSVELAQLALDASSFYNVPVEEAIERFTSALVGNHEAVRQFGVVLTEAELKAEALRQGIETNWNELTNAEKATLRLKLITDSMTDAQGDFARTADEGSNTFRTLWANIKELGRTIGEIFLPYVEKSNKKLTEWISNLSEKLKGATIKGLFMYLRWKFEELTWYVDWFFSDLIGEDKWERFKGRAKAAVDAVINTFKYWADVFTSEEGVMKPIKDVGYLLYENLGKPAWDKIKEQWTLVRTFWKDVFTSEVWGDALDGIDQALERVFGEQRWRNIRKRIADYSKDIWHDLREMGLDVLETAFPGAFPEQPYTPPSKFEWPSEGSGRSQGTPASELPLPNWWHPTGAARPPEPQVVTLSNETPIFITISMDTKTITEEFLRYIQRNNIRLIGPDYLEVEGSRKIVEY